MDSILSQMNPLNAFTSYFFKIHFNIGIRGSIVTRLWAGRPGLDSRQGRGRDPFPFATDSRLILGPTKRPIQWLQEIKRPGCEAYHSHPCSAEVRNAWSYTSTLVYVFMV